LRKLLGAGAKIGSTSGGEEFILGSIIDIKDVPRLLQSGKVRDYSSEEDGIYIEIDLPGRQIGSEMLTIYSGGSHLAFPEGSISPSQLLKVWWDKWEKWGVGFMDKDMLKLLKQNEISPRRENDEDNVGRYEDDEDEELEPVDNTEHVDIPRDYVGPPIHNVRNKKDSAQLLKQFHRGKRQWHESHFYGQLDAVLGTI